MIVPNPGTNDKKDRPEETSAANGDNRENGGPEAYVLEEVPEEEPLFSPKLLLAFVLLVVVMAGGVYLLIPSDLELAQQYRDTGKYNEAADLYKSLLEEDPHRTVVMKELIELYQETGETRKEAKWIQRYLDEEFDRELAERGARLLREFGKYQASGRIYDELMRRYPDHFDYYRNRAMLYSWQGKTDRAMQVFKNAPDDLPELKPFEDTLREIPGDTLALPKSREQLLQIQIRESEDPLPHRIALADHYLSIRRYGKARTLYRKLLPELSTEKKAEVLLKLSNAYVWDNRVQEGIAILEEYLELKPDDLNVRKKVIKLYRDFDMLWKTIPHLERLFRNEAGEAYSLELYAQALEDAGRIPDAILTYQFLLLFRDRHRFVRKIFSLYRSNQDIRKAAFFARMSFRLSDAPDREVVSFLEWYYEKHQLQDSLHHFYNDLIRKTGEQKWRQKQIQLYVRRGEHENAIKHATAFLEKNPKNLPVLKTLAEAYRATDRIDQYLDTRKTIARRFPENTNEVWNSGYALWNRGRKNEALDVFELGLEKGEVSLDRRIDLAMMQADRENYVRAYERLASLARMGPLPPSKLPDLALFARRADRREDALTIIEEESDGLLGDPPDPEYGLPVARAYALVGKTRRALSIYGRLVRARPEDVDMHLTIGRNFIAVDELKEARWFFRKALSVTPDHPEALMRAGQVSMWLGDTPAALHYFERYVSVKPEDVEASYQLGEIFYALGEKRKGFYRQRKTIDLFLDEKPNNEAQMLMYARAAARVGNIDRSLSLHQSVMEQYEVTPNMAASYLKTLLEFEMYQKALSLLNHQFQPYSHRPAFRKFRARIYSATGRTRQAMTILEDEDIMKGEPIGVWIDLGFMNKQLSYWNESMHYIDRALYDSLDLEEMEEASEDETEESGGSEPREQPDGNEDGTEPGVARKMTDGDRKALHVSLGASTTDGAASSDPMEIAESETGSGDSEYLPQIEEDNQARQASRDLTGERLWNLFREKRLILREKRPRLRLEGTYDARENDRLSRHTISLHGPLTKRIQYQVSQSFLSVDGELPGVAGSISNDTSRTGLALDYFRTEKNILHLEANRVAADDPRVSAGGSIQHFFSGTETTVTVGGTAREIWDDPLRAAALNGERSGGHVSIEQKLDQRLTLLLRGEGADVSVDDDRPDLPGDGSADGTEYRGTARFSYVLQQSPFVSLSLTHRHVRRDGEDDLFDLLPLNRENNLSTAGFYYENQLGRHWTGILSGGLGQDFSRDAGLLFFGRAEVNVRPIERVKSWAAFEFSTEGVTTEGGSIQIIELGLELIF